MIGYMPQTTSHPLHALMDNISKELMPEKKFLQIAPLSRFKLYRPPIESRYLFQYGLDKGFQILLLFLRHIKVFVF